MVLRLLPLFAFAACVPETEGLQTEVYEVCYRGLSAKVERVSSESARGRVTVGDVDFGDATVDDPSIGLHSLRVDAREPDSGFGAVQSAHVEVVDLHILDLSPGGTELYGEADSPPNLLDHMTDDTLDLQLVLEGDSLPQSQLVDVDACFDIDGVSVVL